MSIHNIWFCGETRKIFSWYLHVSGAYALKLVTLSQAHIQAVMTVNFSWQGILVYANIKRHWSCVIACMQPVCLIHSAGRQDFFQLESSIIFHLIALDKTLFSIQKYWYFFLFLHKNVCCEYSLEAPWQDTSNEYPQRFRREIRKITWYPLLFRPMYNLSTKTYCGYSLCRTGSSKQF